MFTLRITFTDGSVKDFEAKPVDIIDWETHFDAPISDFGQRGTHQMVLGWLVAKRIGATDKELRDWVNDTVKYEVVDPKA